MIYLYFSTPKSVMRGIFFEIFICVWWSGGGGGREWKMEVGILIVLLSADEGEGKNSVERNTLQV